ncbi:MAG: alpha/beta fold hydrolase [Dehalococcoidia bacterium]|nr:alpha/beta fold hydrolase [Dehalococcoidia bacterium]
MKVGGLNIYYEVHGNGRPLLLICGLGNDLSSWNLQVPDLARRYRVISFDNRGSGRTDAPDQPYSIQMMAGDTAGLMDALRIEKAHVLGVSMGGYIAEELAMAWPRRVSSLVLATTSVGPYMLKISLLQAWVRQALADMSPMASFQIMLPFMFNDRCFEDPRVVEMAVETIAGHSSTPPHILTRQMIACAEHDARDRIGRITTPTLVLAGKEDPFIPFSLTQELAASIPGAMLNILEGGGHGFSASGAERFNRVVLDFLDRVP